MRTMAPVLVVLVLSGSGCGSANEPTPVPDTPRLVRGEVTALVEGFLRTFPGRDDCLAVFQRRLSTPVYEGDGAWIVTTDGFSDRWWRVYEETGVVQSSSPLC